MAEKLTKIEQEQINLGKKLQDFYDSGYVNRKQALLWSFLKGAAGGFGAFLGGTIVIAIIIWTLSRFSSFPLVGPLTHQVQETLQNPKK